MRRILPVLATIGKAPATRMPSGLSRQMLLAAMVVLAVTLAATPSGSASGPSAPSDTPTAVVHPLQLQYWPLLYESYDAQAFLESIGSPLQDVRVSSGEGTTIPFAQALDTICVQYHIHPRILLVLQEIASGAVSGTNVAQAQIDLSTLDSQLGTEDDAVALLHAELSAAARALRESYDKHRLFAAEPGQRTYQSTESVHGIGTSALLELLGSVSDDRRQAGDSRLLKVFADQFTTWFGPLDVAPQETVAAWDPAQTSLPYAQKVSPTDTTGGKYTSAPHSWNSSAPDKQNGLDFSSNNGTVLNIADGWLVDRGTRDIGVGNYAKILIDGTDYIVEYWHLAASALPGKSIGSFIPKGYKIADQGGTCGTARSDCKPWSPHIHLDLSKGVLDPIGTRRNPDTWDGKQLGPDWVFWVNTSEQARKRAVAKALRTCYDKDNRPYKCSAPPWGYDGTAISAGISWDLKQFGSHWSRVEQGYSYATEVSTDHTKFAVSELTSDNSQVSDCDPGPCPSLPKPQILAPTQGAQLQAGRHSSPEKKIGPIRIYTDKQFVTLKREDFSVSIGGIASPVLEATLAGVYNTYELFVAPPAQPSDDRYDLTVAVQGVTLTSPQSVVYGDPVGASYVVVLDTSNSMNCSLLDPNPYACTRTSPETNAKIYEARSKAESFVRLLSDHPQESIGLIRFNGDSGVNAYDGSPQPATQVRRDYLVSILRTIIGSGGTPLYDSIIAGVQKLSGSTAPTRIVMVLSDGANSSGSANLATAIQTAKDAGVQVCTIRFGVAADLAVLNALSRETGCVAAQVALEPGELVSAFDAIRSGVTGAQTVKTFPGVLQAGETKEYSTPIDALTEAVFKVEWQAPTAEPSAQLRLNLIAPDGTHYTPDDLHGAEYISGITLSAFRITNPVAGVWRLIVSRASSWAPRLSDLSDAAVSFEASVLGDSVLAIRSYATNVVEAGRLLQLGASVASTETITGATVLVTIGRPSGSAIVLPLLDDGKHGDGLASDGYYAATYDDTFNVGRYKLEFDVEGRLPGGMPFHRFARRDVEVQGDAGQGSIELPLAAGLNLFSLNGLAPIDRDPRMALLSAADAYTMLLSFRYPDGALAFYSDLPDEFNTLNEIDPYQGYWIRTTRPVTLVVTGPNLQQDAYLPVHPGWNLVPYLPAASSLITDALSSLHGNYLAVRGYSGGAMSYWPQLPATMNTLQLLEPDLAYWILVTGTHTILDYPPYFAGLPATQLMPPPESGEGATAANRPQASAGVQPTEKWADFYSFEVMFGGHPAHPGTIVSVYDGDGRKIGESVVTTTGWMGVLSAYGDSAFTGGKDGASPGDLLTFRLNGMPATATDMSGNPVRWARDASLLQIRISSPDAYSYSNFLPVVVQGEQSSPGTR